MIRLLLVAFFMEVGFVLVVVPWSAYWDRNYFAQLLPHIHAVITNNFIRGAISGLGVINLVAGLLDLVSIVISRNVHDSALRIGPPHVSEE